MTNRAGYLCCPRWQCWGAHLLCSVTIIPAEELWTSSRPQWSLNPWNAAKNYPSPKLGSKHSSRLLQNKCWKQQNQHSPPTPQSRHLLLLVNSQWRLVVIEAETEHHPFALDLVLSNNKINKCMAKLEIIPFFQSFNNIFPWPYYPLHAILQLWVMIHSWEKFLNHDLTLVMEYLIIK